MGIEVSALAYFQLVLPLLCFCESASGYFASRSASQHAIGQIFLNRLAVYQGRPHSRTAGIFLVETTGHAYPHTQHVSLPRYIMIT